MLSYREFETVFESKEFKVALAKVPKEERVRVMTALEELVRQFHVQLVIPLEKARGSSYRTHP